MFEAPATTEHTVYPFKDRRGDEVPAHALVRTRTSWMPKHITHVVFQHYDHDAEMMVNVVIHWTKFSQYYRKSPNAHSIVAVMDEAGHKYHTNTYSVAHYDDAAWHRAPILARGVFKVTVQGHTVLEVKGVSAWSYSKRDAEAAKLIPDPLAESNAKFAAEQARLKRQRQAYVLDDNDFEAMVS